MRPQTSRATVEIDSGCKTLIIAYRKIPSDRQSHVGGRASQDILLVRDAYLEGVDELVGAQTAGYVNKRERRRRQQQWREPEQGAEDVDDSEPRE